MTAQKLSSFVDKLDVCKPKEKSLDTAIFFDDTGQFLQEGLPVSRSVGYDFSVSVRSLD